MPWIADLWYGFAKLYANTTVWCFNKIWISKSNKVHHKFDLQHETLFLTVNLIDRFLAKQNVVRKKLQLVGLVAMLLACKYEEVSVPVVDDLIFISDKAYSRNEILEMVLKSSTIFSLILLKQQPKLKFFFIFFVLFFKRKS